jgi:peroxiredoxin
MSQLSTGVSAPDFELPDIYGRPHRLAEALTRGPVALVFYKSACPTCQFTFPYLQKIFSKRGESRGWTLWGVSEDDPEETRQFMQDHGITFDVLLDEYPYGVSAAYGLEFVPALFVIQPDGKISTSDYGFTKAGLNQIAGYDFFTPGD